MMRVAYVCADPGVPVFGHKGCSIHVQEVLRQLLQWYGEVHLFARHASAPRPAGLDRVILHPLDLLPGPPTPQREQLLQLGNRQLRILLEQAGPFDLVYERHALWSCAAMQYARDHDIPAILEVNAPLVEEHQRHRGLYDPGAAARLASSALRSASIVVAVSSAVAAWCRRQGAAADQVHVIGNGVDRARFRTARRSIDHRRGAWRNQADFVIGFVGTLRPWHGLAQLGRAFREFHRLVPASRLLIVGDGPARSELDAELDDGASRATVISGHVPHDEVGRWMSYMDVGVAPYPNSPDFYFSPLKVLEYMAAGLPTVVSRQGDLPQIIQHGRNGWLVTPDNTDELVTAWCQLHRSPELARSLGRAAWQTVATHHSWNQVVRRTLDCLPVACAPPSGRRASIRSAG